MLRVTVIKCTGLAATHPDGFSHPFCEITIKNGEQTFKRTGQPISRTVAPEFNQAFDFLGLDHSQPMSLKVVIRCTSKAAVGRRLSSSISSHTQFLGQAKEVLRTSGVPQPVRVLLDGALLLADPSFKVDPGHLRNKLPYYNSTNQSGHRSPYGMVQLCAVSGDSLAAMEAFEPLELAVPVDAELRDQKAEPEQGLGRVQQQGDLAQWRNLQPEALVLQPVGSAARQQQAVLERRPGDLEAAADVANVNGDVVTSPAMRTAFSSAMAAKAESSLVNRSAHPTTVSDRSVHPTAVSGRTAKACGQENSPARPADVSSSPAGGTILSASQAAKPIRQTSPVMQNTFSHVLMASADVPSNVGTAAAVATADAGVAAAVEAAAAAAASVCRCLYLAFIRTPILELAQSARFSRVRWGAFRNRRGMRFDAEFGRRQ